MREGRDTDLNGMVLQNVLLLTQNYDVLEWLGDGVWDPVSLEHSRHRHHQVQQQARHQIQGNGGHWEGKREVKGVKCGNVKMGKYICRKWKNQIKKSTFSMLRYTLFIFFNLYIFPFFHEYFFPFLLF